MADEKTETKKDCDHILGDGTKITFDLRKVTRAQWKGMFDPAQSDEDSDATLARAAGMTFEAVVALDMVEYKKLINAFYDRMRNPLSDPNA